MNYIEEINRFERWLETNYLPAQSQLLWYKLLMLFNRCGWAEWITVDNQRLMGLIQCESKNTFLRVRNQLLETGLISYRKGKKGAPSQYHLIGFSSKNEPKMKPETKLFLEPDIELYSKPQTGHINKHKLKPNNNTPHKSPQGDDVALQAESLKVETAGGAGKPVDHSTTLDKQWFDEFFEEYPRQVGKGAAEEAWNKINPDRTLFDSIMSALKAAKKSDQWRRDNGRYIPNPSKWLNERRWEDKIPDGWETSTRNHEQTNSRADFRIPGITEL